MPSDPDAALQFGDGAFVTTRRLGQGGMGEVYEGRQVALDRPVAIKVLKRALSGDAELLARFSREAKVLATVVHPNVVAIIDYLPPSGSGPACIVMELVRGAPLETLIKLEGRFGWRRALELTAQVLAALEAIHAHDIVHRDLKPANLLVTTVPGQGEVVKVADFGIARTEDDQSRLTRTGVLVGTPRYMAPEQLSGAPTDHRVDLWALGVVLHRMLTGQHAFRGETGDLIQSILRDPPAPADDSVPPEVFALALRALEKRPERRFASATEMREATLALLARPSVPRLRGSEPEAPMTLLSAPPTMLTVDPAFAAPTMVTATAPPVTTPPATTGATPDATRPLGPAPRRSRVLWALAASALGAALLLVIAGVVWIWKRPVSGDLPFGAPRAAALSDYLALVEPRARAADLPTGPTLIELRGLVDAQNRLDFDAEPQSILSVAYGVGTACRRWVIAPGAGEAGAPKRCAGEPLTQPLPPLVRIVAASWEACPEISRFSRAIHLAAWQLGGEPFVEVSSTYDDAEVVFRVIEDELEVVDLRGECEGSGLDPWVEDAPPGEESSEDTEALDVDVEATGEVESGVPPAP